MESLEEKLRLMARAPRASAASQELRQHEEFVVVGDCVHRQPGFVSDSPQSNVGRSIHDLLGTDWGRENNARFWKLANEIRRLQVDHHVEILDVVLQPGYQVALIRKRPKRTMRRLWEELTALCASQLNRAQRRIVAKVTDPIIEALDNRLERLERSLRERSTSDKKSPVRAVR